MAGHGEARLGSARHGKELGSAWLGPARLCKEQLSESAYTKGASAGCVSL
jgi:hypothetical protein